MIIQPSYRMIVWSTMKNFSDLLQEALSIKLSCRREGIFTEQNVFTFQSGIETIKTIRKQIENLLIGEEVEWLFLSPI